MKRTLRLFVPKLNTDVVLMKSASVTYNDSGHAERHDRAAHPYLMTGAF